MEAETELIALRSDTAGAGDAGFRSGHGALGSAATSRAAAVIDAYFQDLRAEVDASSPGGGGSSSSRANRLRLYGDERSCAALIAASHRHLETHQDRFLHQDWLVGSRALTNEQLRACIALQHLTVIDVEDLGLPPEMRRSADDFTEEGVSQQFILDAGRSDFVLPGVECLSFRRELELKGASLEADSLEVERLLRAFEERLTAALLRALGTGAPPILVQAISRCMSQSGMANLERAVTGPRIVVSGGEQTLRYELLAVSPGVWEVSSSLRKFDFEQFVALEEGGGDDGSGKVQVLECGPGSQISRGCRIRFQLLRSGSLNVDVRGLSDQVELLDRFGKPLHLSTGGRRKCGLDWKAALSRQAVLLVQCWALRPHVHFVALVSKAVTRCRHCRRRSRGGAQPISSGLEIPGMPVSGHRALCGTEDADSMCAPLRGASLV